MNRAQQAFYLENQRFAVDTAAVAASAPGATPVVAASPASTASEKLGIGVTNTSNYTYTLTATDPTLDVINKGSSLNKDLKGHVGAAFSTGGQTPTILCEATTAAISTATNLPAPTNTSGTIACASGTAKVGG